MLRKLLTQLHVHGHLVDLSSEQPTLQNITPTFRTPALPECPTHTLPPRAEFTKPADAYLWTALQVSPSIGSNDDLR